DPQWVRETIDGVEHYWAPELVERDGAWYLYDPASTVGSNTPAIGLAASPTLDPADPDYGRTREGAAWRSQAGAASDDASDRGAGEDTDGSPWLFFGSCWGGIQMVPLEWPSGMPADGAEPTMVATRSGVPE